MKIILCCSAGMSTSMLCKKILAAAKDKGREDVICDAYSSESIDEHAKDASVILLGPQIRVQFKEIAEKYAPIPVAVIDMRAYGLMDGKKVFESALKLMDEAGTNKN